MNEQPSAEDPLVTRSDELTRSAEAAIARLDQQAPKINRVADFLREHKDQNRFGLEYQLTFVRRTG